MSGRKYWIEVTSGIRWERMLQSGVALEAPSARKYQRYLGGVQPGDVVLHYLTNALTSNRALQSRIVATSVVDSIPRVVGRRIVATCKDTQWLPVPISRLELSALPVKSQLLRQILKMSMQRYLTEISMNDFAAIMKIHKENQSGILKKEEETTIQPGDSEL